MQNGMRMAATATRITARPTATATPTLSPRLDDDDDWILSHTTGVLSTGSELIEGDVVVEETDTNSVAVSLLLQVKYYLLHKPMAGLEQETHSPHVTDIRTPRTLTVGPSDAQFWMSAVSRFELFPQEELGILALKKTELVGPMGQERLPLTSTPVVVLD